MECDWDDETLISFTEDDTIFGPQGVYGWFMKIWYKFFAPESAFETLDRA